DYRRTVRTKTQGSSQRNSVRRARGSDVGEEIQALYVDGGRNATETCQECDQTWGARDIRPHLGALIAFGGRSVPWLPRPGKPRVPNRHGHATNAGRLLES